MYLLSFYCGHDSNICLMKDGKILIHLEAERITRIKSMDGVVLNDPKLQKGKPWEKEGVLYFVGLIFKRFGITWDDIQAVVTIDEVFEDHKLVPEHIPVIRMNHHEAHAASAFFMSPFKESLVLSLDGGGNDGGGLLGYGEGNHITIKRKINDTVRDNDFYASTGTDAIASGVIGGIWYNSMKYWSDTKHGPIGTEGVLMGAAPYGIENKKLSDFFYQHMLLVQPVHRRIIKAILEEKLLGIVPADFSSEEEKYYLSYCNALQKATDRIFKDLFAELLTYRKTNNVCLAGGVTLNCVSIGRLLEKYPKLNLYFCPAVNDGGLSLGAVLWAYHQIMGNERIIEKGFHTPYMGFDHEGYDYDKLFRRFESKIIVEGKTDHARIAELVAEGNLISIYKGKSESGKRALGNRSIIADPRDKGMKDKINTKIKHRQWYRPFAPSVLKDKVKMVFEKDLDSPYMSLAIPIRNTWKSRIPAVCHIDGTARLQTVTRELNPEYYEIIHQFYLKTGVPLVLNTSFNDNEPIVESPDDAMRCFLNTEIDYLYMEGYLIRKRK